MQRYARPSPAAADVGAENPAEAPSPRKHFLGNGNATGNATHAYKNTLTHSNQEERTNGEEEKRNKQTGSGQEKSVIKSKCKQKQML